MKFVGLAAMDRKLLAIRDAVSPASRERSLMAGAVIIQAEAQRLVPVLTGNLRESIIISFDAGLNFAAVKQSRFFSAIYVGPSKDQGFYGHMVELGTSHSPAHPFMRPALDNTREEVRRAMGSSLWADVKKAA
ncbi:HK97-gp10 family putative phage morphogenesis protein [Sphingobium cupriresistens]|uniref:HK97 gp10 family phage protein n=1 Tax=Sphingobium cupriresistens LL01 TaxID=1420583 RepID=A0A0J7XUI4_9SPHN|nr:HK97-gp10 family putative phage morphogenesis protein [Sphingobium cupriresistens]KMS54718.1 hypothetical protein V473_15380 [Sphingobium cupriresistens LL01]